MSPLRRFGLSEEAELLILVAILIGTMFTCTEVLARKLDRVADAHKEQLSILLAMKDATVNQSQINIDLSERLQSIENELKLVGNSQQDMLIRLREKKDK